MKSIGVIRFGRKGLSHQEQRRRLVEHGCHDIWELGRNSQSVAEMLAKRALRRDTELVVWDLAYLPDKGRMAGDDLTDWFVSILDTGARVVELSTGRSYQGPSEGARMLGDARSRLARRAVGEKRREGRPAKHYYTPEQRVLIEAIWRNPAHKNDDAREAAIRAAAGGNMEPVKHFNRHAWRRPWRDTK